MAEFANIAPEFLFVVCQVGAERALKAEVARRWPELHFAYSRPGFVTFKLSEGLKLPDDIDLGCVFARASGFTLEKVSGTDVNVRAGKVARLAAENAYGALHVWQRDAARPGFRGFEPHITPAAIEAETAIRQVWPAGTEPALPARIAAPGELVLDCILVEPELWWLGYHRSRRSESCYPGAMRDIETPKEVVSRAWIKMEEALRWAALPIRHGDRFVELGCSPGGASQALLEHGLRVIGVDPAKVDARVLEHPRFTHVQKRASDVRRREFRGVRWLAADMNVAPEDTLDAVEAIVTYPGVDIRGLILTLKLLDWDAATRLDEHLERVRSWGYQRVEARQLVHNRQEVCVAALRDTKNVTGRKPRQRR